MSEIKLNPCPFCGGKISLVLCDDEGNLHDEAYREHPYSLDLCFTTLTRKTRNARLQAMSAMVGFWAVCIFTTRKNKLLKHGTGGLTMAKAVLISIRPEWVEEIANRRKTIEVRKTKPNLEAPFKCYIYCTNTRPFLVWGDVFRGDWFTEFTHLSGYGRSG